MSCSPEWLPAPGAALRTALTCGLLASWWDLIDKVFQIADAGWDMVHNYISVCLPDDVSQNMQAKNDPYIKHKNRRMDLTLSKPVI